MRIPVSNRIHWLLSHVTLSLNNDRVLQDPSASKSWAYSAAVNSVCSRMFRRILIFGDFTLFAVNPSFMRVEWIVALQKACRVRDRLERATELYKSVFSEFEQEVLDRHAIQNIMKIYFMVKISRESETAETFFYLKEALRLYNEAFVTAWKMLDEDPVGNMISLAQYMMEAKEPTRHAVTASEVVARIIESGK